MQYNSTFKLVLLDKMLHATKKKKPHALSQFCTSPFTQHTLLYDFAITQHSNGRKTSHPVKFQCKESLMFLKHHTARFATGTTALWYQNGGGKSNRDN